MIIPQKTMHNWQNSFFFPKHPAHMQANPIYCTPFPLQRRSTTWRNTAPVRQNTFLSPSFLRKSQVPPTDPESIYDQEHVEMMYASDFSPVSSFAESLEKTIHNPETIEPSSFIPYSAENPPMPEDIGRMMGNADSEIEIEPENHEKSPEETEGLSRFKKWWYLRNVDISINGNLLTGFPIFILDNTLRVINDKFSYFIPMRNVEYIRTSDGFNAIQEHFNGCFDN